MLKAKVIRTKVGEKESEHTFYYHDNNATGLVVIFPGGGNSCNRPILHYSRKYLLDKNYDVLNVSYTHLTEDDDSVEVQLDKLSKAIYEAIQSVSEHKNYQNLVFITRSAGNIISNELKIKYHLHVDRCVYISPTSDATKYFDEFPGFIITATNDRFITDDEVHELAIKYQDHILVFEEGTHALENESLDQTLAFCKAAVIKILDYITNEK